MKYKVGDTVKIRSDIEIGKTYDKYAFSRKMAEYKNKVLHISNVSNDYYNLKEDESKHWWTDEMLEPGHKYKIGDCVQIRSDLNTNESYGGMWAIDEMLPFKGTYQSIKSVDIYGCYKLFDVPYCWSNEMLVDINKSDLKVSSTSSEPHIDCKDNCICDNTDNCYKPISSPKPIKQNTYTEIKLSKPKTKKYKFYEEN